MGIVVQKYGGTSVGSIERIRAVAKRVQRTRASGKQVVVVVSAMAGETDRLLQLAYDICAQPAARELDRIARRVGGGESRHDDEIPIHPHHAAAGDRPVEREVRSGDRRLGNRLREHHEQTVVRGGRRAAGHDPIRGVDDGGSHRLRRPVREFEGAVLSQVI